MIARAVDTWEEKNGNIGRNFFDSVPNGGTAMKDPKTDPCTVRLL